MTEINTPQVRERISDLMHEQLEGRVSDERIAKVVGALFVLMNQSSADSAPVTTRPAVVDPNVAVDPDGDARFLSDVLHLAQHVRTYAEPGEVHNVAVRVIAEVAGRGGQSLPDLSEVAAPASEVAQHASDERCFYCATDEELTAGLAGRNRRTIHMNLPVEACPESDPADFQPRPSAGEVQAR